MANLHNDWLDTMKDFSLNREEANQQHATTAAVNHNHVWMEEHVARSVTSEEKGCSAHARRVLQDFGVK